MGCVGSVFWRSREGEKTSPAGLLPYFSLAKAQHIALLSFSPLRTGSLMTLEVLVEKRILLASD